jgi:hypothetical protein
MKLTEELLGTLASLNPDKYSEFEEQIINNNKKLELKVDEVTYLIGIA